LKFLAIIFSLSFPLFAENIQERMASYDELNLTWILISAALVLLMQAGFTAVETGMIRAKNSINVAIKNAIDLMFAIVIFFLVGYAFMFGDSVGGWIGFSHFGLSDVTEEYDFAFFVFQAMFAGTTITIVSGAVAERMNFLGYVLAGVILIAFVYPVFGHWTWGGGWLSEMGFMDFAGSTIVHSIGAWAGLSATLIMGPRIGRFRKGEVVEIPSYNLSTVAVGIFILWFGWFGFNGGSTLGITDNVAKIILNTNISAAFGGVTAFFISIFLYGKPHVDKVMFGALAGLVGITAGCDVVSTGGAVGIGVLSGIAMYVGEYVLIKLKIDDPVSAIPVHGFAGAVGTISLAIFAPESSLSTGGMWSQIYVQTFGVVTGFLWAFLIGIFIFTIFKGMGILRVSHKDEYIGLNASEHDAKFEFNDALKTINQIVASGDFSKRMKVEPNSEVAILARSFNELLNDIETSAKTMSRIADGDLGIEIVPRSQKDLLRNSLKNMIFNMRNAIVEIQEGSETIQKNLENIQHSKNVFVDSNSQFMKGIDNITISLYNANLGEGSAVLHNDIQKGEKAIRQSIADIEDVNDSLGDIVSAIEKLDSKARNVKDTIAKLEEISDQTNLLALNAAVEAAHAGMHGKGFTVIADEVQKLAENSVILTRNVGKIVDEMLEEANNTRNQTAEGQKRVVKLTKESKNSLSALDKISNLTSNTFAIISNILDLIKQQSKNRGESEHMLQTLSISLSQVMGRSVKLQNSVSNFKA
jgi:Amt family ammonium transporter